MAEGDLVLTRVLKAPRELVWRVWTEAAHLAKWWGPAGFAMKVTALDLRTGGLFHYAMTPPGSERAVWGRFLYDEVNPPGRLVFRSAFSDEQGGVTVNPWNARWPLEIRNVLTLDEQDGVTTLTLVGSPFQASPEGMAVFQQNRDNVRQGFLGTFAQLDAYLEAEQEAARTLVYRRTFDAPRAVVWKAWTTPQSIAAWYGPSGFGNTIRTMDVRVGGRWLFTMHGPDGTDYPNEVTYLEVSEPSRLVYDHGNPGEPSHFRVTVTFSENGTRTDMEYRMRFPSAEAKTMTVEKYGATEGLSQNMDRFARWLSLTGTVVTRVFSAPRARLWKAFTDPSWLIQWWGPERFTCPGAHVDLRAGGSYLLGMRGPEGQEFWSAGSYREVVPHERLVYTDNFADAEGRVIPASALGLPGQWPDERLVTVDFEELGKDKTLVTVHQHHSPEAWKEMTLAGWATSFDKLERVLG